MGQRTLINSGPVSEGQVRLTDAFLPSTADLRMWASLSGAVTGRHALSWMRWYPRQRYGVGSPSVTGLPATRTSKIKPVTQDLDQDLLVANRD